MVAGGETGKLDFFYFFFLRILIALFKRQGDSLEIFFLPLIFSFLLPLAWELQVTARTGD